MNSCSRCGVGGHLRSGLCNRHYLRERRRLIAYGRWGTRLLGAEPVRVHIEDLHAAGMAYTRIADVSGVHERTIDRLRFDRPELVSKHTADRLLAVPIPHSPVTAAAMSNWVPALGAQRRLRSLIAAGWPQAQLAARLGISAANFGVLLHDREYVTARRHFEVVALWTELQMQPGPSDRARKYGRDRGWPLPMQWDEDDLDNPAAVPTARPKRTALKPQVDRAVVAAEYTHARTQLGMSNVAALRYIIDAFDVSPRTMRRWGYDVSLIEAAERTQRDQQRRRAA